MRAVITRTLRPLAVHRSFATTARVMAGGDAGSGISRAGGERAGDSFTRREKANEDLYIKEQERQKLQQLKEQLAAQKKHIGELENHINSIMKESGGEQH